MPHRGRGRVLALAEVKVVSPAGHPPPHERAPVLPTLLAKSAAQRGI